MDHESWKGEEFAAPPVPSMITAEEKQYLYWMGRTVWSGTGAVLELGAWLGGSTVCLAHGMQASSHDARRRLYVFDRFIWEEYMSSLSDLPYKPGDSFESLFWENVKSYDEIIRHAVCAIPDQPGENCAGELQPFRWEKENPVELLFIDGAKSWYGLLRLLSELREDFLPGQTFLLCQDYKWWSCWWVPVAASRLWEYLEPVHNVLGGCTVTFRLVSPIPAGLLESWEEHVYELRTAATLHEIEMAACQLAEDGDLIGSAVVSLSKTTFLCYQGNKAAAVEELQKSERLWPDPHNTVQLEQARQFLET